MIRSFTKSGRYCSAAHYLTRIQKFYNPRPFSCPKEKASQRMSARHEQGTLDFHNVGKTLFLSMFSVFTGSVKLGQPVLKSNFVSEENNSAPHVVQTYIPFSSECRYLPVKGTSVPFSRMTRYCSGLSCSFQLFSIFLD